MIYKKFEKAVIKVLTLVCTLCLVTVESPFCVYIFHELVEPEGIELWRIKHGKQISKNYD